MRTNNFLNTLRTGIDNAQMNEALQKDVVNKLETWPRVASWAVTAETRNGCAWPSTFTAIPPSRSR